MDRKICPRSTFTGVQQARDDVMNAPCLVHNIVRAAALRIDVGNKLCN